MTSADDAHNLASKPATPHTHAAHLAAAAVLSFDDAADFERAGRGLIAEIPGGVITRDGRPVWDVHNHDFLRTEEPAPNTVHPGLWRQGRLNAIHGLFEVADGVWQARGYDISNITFMAGDDGWLIIDPLTTEATARACLELANATLGERPVTSVIYTHSHVDHFGGVHGVTSQEEVDAGNVGIVAPEGFIHEVVSENAIAGSIMTRRAMYQFGPLLPTGPQGQVDVGLGQAIPLGQAGLIAPTEIISETGQELTLSGIPIVFQNTPDAEAPAEMNFFFPDKRLLCMAENCSHTLHNLYPLRGAKTRDALAWSKYIHEALTMWGDSSDVMFASHHWPRFGQDDLKHFLATQRDVYRWMHDQTMRLANHGHVPTEIAHELTLPGDFAASHVQGYYGTVSHNVRSVYDLYLGWYHGNPAHLNPLPPTDAGAKYVAAMGGAQQVLRTAREAFDKGEYRWATEVLNHLVFSEPDNREARALQADSMEQLGYQSESGTWRNAYLMGAQELRSGTPNFGRMPGRRFANAVQAENLFDIMGVRFNPARFEPETASFNWHFTDIEEHHVLGVARQTIHHSPHATDHDAQTSISLSREDFFALSEDPEARTELVANGAITISGDQALLFAFLDALDHFETAALIEP